MKKFKFSLETVLSYKQQILDALQVEHAAILADVRRQEACIAEMKAKYEALAAEYAKRSAKGMGMLDVWSFQEGLRAMERDLKHMEEQLLALRKKAAEKQEEVILAKQDTSSIEKLKEKKLHLYTADAAKGEEQFIEEFVSSRRAAAGMP